MMRFKTVPAAVVILLVTSAVQAAGQVGTAGPGARMRITIASTITLRDLAAMAEVDVDSDLSITGATVTVHRGDGKAQSFRRLALARKAFSLPWTIE